MVLYTAPFNAGPEGEALSLVNAPYLSHVVQAAGSTATYDDAMAAVNGFGVRFANVAGGNSYGRVTMAQEAASFSVSYSFTSPAANPTGNLAILSCLTTADVAVGVILWQSTGKLVWRVSTGSATGETELAAAGVLLPSTKYRLTWTQTATGWTIKLFQANTGTQIGTTKTLQLAQAAVRYFNIGVANASTSANVVGVGNFRVNSDSTAELGPVAAAAAPIVFPESVTSNPGNYTNEGGASSLVAALSDGLDTTFIRSGGQVNNEAITLRLQPLAAGDVKVRVLLRAAIAGTVARVELLEGTTVRATFNQALTLQMAEYPFQLSTAQRDSIGDRTNLSLRITGAVV